VNRGKTFNSHTAETCKGRLKAEALRLKKEAGGGGGGGGGGVPKPGAEKGGTDAETLQEGWGEEGEAGKV
jgi:hypothetical protein